MQENSFEKIPLSFLKKWQEIADLIANILQVPAALIMKAENEFMEVFTSSKTENNPYKVGDAEPWHGLYCETVIKTQRKLHIPNALKDKNWDKNPDIKLGMIAYLGYPINFPDQKPFGTLCVLDTKERQFNAENEVLFLQFKNVLELDLALIFSLKLEGNCGHGEIIEKLLHTNEELQITNEKIKKRQEALIIKGAKKLKHSHELLNYIVKHNRSAVAVHDRDLKYIYVSQRYIDDLKIKESDLIGKHPYDIFPDLPKKWRDIHQKALAGEVSSAEKDPFYRKDGSVEWTRWECRPWHESDGSIGGMIIYIEVITERIEAEKRNDLLASIIQRSNDFIGVADANQQPIFVNSAGQKMLGLDGDKGFKATKIEDYFMPEDLPFVRETIIPTLNQEGRWAGEFRLRHFKTGKPIPVLYDLFKTINQDTGEVTNISTVSRDISQIKEAEEKIRQSQQLLQNISDNMFDLVSLTDLQGNYTFANASHKIMGYQTDKLIGTNVMEYVHPDDYPVVMAAFQEFMSGNADTRKIVYRNRRADGTYLWLETVGRFIRDEKGNPQQILFNTRDITDRKKNDVALRESEEKYRTLFESMNEGVFYQTKEGKLIDLNQKALDLFGLSEDEISGRTAFHPDWKVVDSHGVVLPPEQHPSMVALSTGKPVLNQEIGVFIPKINEYRWLLVNAIPQFRPNEDDPYQVFVTMSDITRLKSSEEHLKERNAFIQTILDNLPIGVALNNFNMGTATYMNEKFKEIYGWEEEDIVNIATFFEKVYPDKAYREKWTKQFMDDIQSGDPERMRWENISIKRKDGTTGIINAANIPLIEQNTMVSTVMDVTREKIAEEMRKELEVANKTAKFKQNFLANMSHEIRTPLTGVLGMIEIMEQTTLTEAQKDYLNTIKISGENLREIINQVLDYSKIEAGKVTIQPRVFEFLSLSGSAISLYKNNVHAGVNLQCTIDPNIPEWIEADNARLSQVLNNLISNAVKFTSQGSITIESSLAYSHPENGQVIIEIKVTDTGQGISENLQNKLFDPFFQIEAEDTRNYEGTGLGLSICKELVKMMDGEIGMVSEVGKGSTFWFTFPAKTAQKPLLVILEQGSSQTAKKLHILLAEDKVINQKVVKLMLSSMGHKVTIARNGQEALDLYQPGHFNLILMDIQMPVMDGVTATKKLKAKYDDLPPIVGLSANAFEGDREKYMGLGMNEYLTKPVKKGDFVEIMKKLLG